MFITVQQCLNCSHTRHLFAWDVKYVCILTFQVKKLILIFLCIVIPVLSILK